jgi:hypothetical protein
MEKVLSLYEMPYDPKYPLIVFDERPCQLIGDVLLPLPMKKGKLKREDYHYKRNGTCSILLAYEPLTGKLFVEVYKQRTRKEYAIFMKKVSDFYSNVHKIRLVQDNLNTHTPGSFYKEFSPEEAFRLSEHFEMYYTPKHASWLNMAELVLAALSKQCLDRRINDMETMIKEVAAWVDERSKYKLKVNWRFTKEKAREKLKRHYENIGQN